MTLVEPGWSSGGAAYAETAARAFEIDDCSIAFLRNPHIFIDDLTLAAWPERVALHLNKARATSVAALRRRLGSSHEP